MSTRLVLGFVLLVILQHPHAVGQDTLQSAGKLPASDSRVAVWWTLSSAAKVRPDTSVPADSTAAVQMRSARNEYESVQVMVRPAQLLQHFTMTAGTFESVVQGGSPIDKVDILHAAYVPVSKPTDRTSKAGLWPDPLIPVREPMDLAPGTNHAFWIRVFVPPSAASGISRCVLKLRADGWQSDVPVELNVYNFSLPDRMTCQTAFGFSPGEVFRYQGANDPESKRAVLDKYWADLSAHHISPYDPAPLDPFQVTWPDVHPPREVLAGWRNVRLVQNEFHSGRSALLVSDEDAHQNVGVSYEPLVPIPPSGLDLRFWFRTAIPGHSFTVSLNHYDADQQWLSGKNRDFHLEGTGLWQPAEYRLTEFPPAARYVRLNLYATDWTDAGEKLGLVWFDDLSLKNAGTGADLIPGGDFEPVKRTQLCAPAEQLHPTFDFTAWDHAMTKALDTYHFSSFSVPIPGLGGGTFFELSQPNLRGFGEDAPEYSLLLGSYCQQMEAHLQAKGWLDRSFIYWFDEPKESQYAYLQSGFAKLKRYCPQIPRMITKKVEPGLLGGPNIWCPISNEFQPERAQARLKEGERFWWYVCTGPKAPYAGLFLDHSAPEMRIWLWQTYQRHISGILVWQCNYWSSSTAYPDAQHPQNPFEDPMSWTSGYGTPAGTKRPWGNGDGRFIYPPLTAASANPAAPVLDGPVDSIRWEQLRDGIEDYEYLTILQRRLDQRRDGLAPEVVRRYEQLLLVPPSITRTATEFTADGRPIELRRDEIARAIESL